MNQTLKQQIWSTLKTHADALFHNHGKPISTQTNHALSACGIHLDYSSQHISSKTLDLLFKLAETCKLDDKIQALMQGEIINLSEKRPALHTALRAPGDHAILVNGRNVAKEIASTRQTMQIIATQIRNKQWLGYTGKPITDIVNIGIGGSDLGPRFCIEALSSFSSSDLRYYFISDAEPTAFSATVKHLNPETTLFIVSSKSFTTPETLYNAEKAMAWVGKAHLDRHFIAVSANTDKAYASGFKTVLPIWDFIGGRYSFCSAINLIAAIALGFDQFQEMLDGAHHMDLHFKEHPLAANMPVILALIGIFNNNFLSIHNHLMLTYARPLDKFVAYVQQLDMESNGKSIDNQGKSVNYATGPIIWGGPGNQAQHSYYQLLCQGTHQFTADFITLDTYEDELINHLANAKMATLSNGVHALSQPTDFIAGNIPLNHIRLAHITPFTIGALVALYEHKIFTQSIIWNINAFDQPGVESAKRRCTTSLAVS